MTLKWTSVSGLYNVVMITGEQVNCVKDQLGNEGQLSQTEDSGMCSKRSATASFVDDALFTLHNTHIF